MKENGTSGMRMVRVNSSMLMEISTMVNGRMIRPMDKASISIPRVQSIRACGKRINSTAEA
jgi:hypothetical protein